MLSEGKALAVYLVSTGNADEGAGVNALDNLHKIGILTHGKGDRENGLRLTGITAEGNDHCGSTSYLISDSEVDLLIFIRNYLCGKGAVAADEYLINNLRCDPGRDYAKQGVGKILDNEEAEHHGGSINNKDNGRALPLLKELTENKGKNINSAG